MEKIMIGLGLGALAGLIDIIPMLLQKLPWNANLSAFIMWLVVGFFVATTGLMIHPVLLGLLIAVLVLLPSAPIIAGDNPSKLLPIGIMTVILGGVLGWLVSILAR